MVHYHIIFPNICLYISIGFNWPNPNEETKFGWLKSRYVFTSILFAHLLIDSCFSYNRLRLVSNSFKKQKIS